MKLFYKPLYKLLIIDILSILLVFSVILGWFPLTTQTPFIKYNSLFIFFFICWISCSYLLKRYKRNQSYIRASVRLLVTSVIVFFLAWFFIILNKEQNLSERVLLIITLGIFTVGYFFTFIYYALRYAVSYDIPKETVNPSLRKNAEKREQQTLSDEAYEQLRSDISSSTNDRVLHFLESKYSLKSGNVGIFLKNKFGNIKDIENYYYSSIVLLDRLNDIRGINILFYQLNQKLPDNGEFVCYFESKSSRKKIILNKFPKYINYVVYSGYYVIKRLLPRIFLTKRIYYDVTKGKKRVLSKAEVLGRLYYSGFEVLSDKKIGNHTYITAQRATYPQPYESKTYGPLIRLPRIGKNGKKFNVYKFRTMHPYSEYLQPYIFEKNNLQEGGKIKRDIRVTTLGGFMRKYWLDELPMIINLLKGDMKVIGIRPLSQHYFSLYSTELQGLLPPFYADMPKTLEDIQNSEMKYLKACKDKGTFRTDFRYFFLILNNILFNKARSA